MRRADVMAALLATWAAASGIACDDVRDATAQDVVPAVRPRVVPPSDDSMWGHVEVARAGQPLVEGKNLRIEAEQVAAIANARAGAFRHRFRDGASLDELVADVTRDRLLADEARRRGIARRADVAQQIDELLARELLRERLAAIDRMRVDEATLRQWYQANIRLYTRPPQVRARVMGVADPAEARRLRARAGSMSQDRFTALARREAEGPSRRHGGATGWFDTEAGTVDPAVIRACFATSLSEGLLPGVVKGDDSYWYLVFITGREGAEIRPFERVMRSVESHWRADRRARAEDALVAELVSRRSVTMHPVAGVLRYRGGPAVDGGVATIAGDTGPIETPSAAPPIDDEDDDDEGHDDGMDAGTR